MVLDLVLVCGKFEGGRFYKDVSQVLRRRWRKYQFVDNNVFVVRTSYRCQLTTFSNEEVPFDVTESHFDAVHICDTSRELRCFSFANNIFCSLLNYRVSQKNVPYNGVQVCL